MNTQLQAAANALASKTQESAFSIDSLNQELDALKLRNSQQTNRLELDYTKQLSSEKERFAQEREKARVDAEKNIRDLEMKHQEKVRSTYLIRKIKNMSEKLASLTEAHSNTSNKLNTLQDAFYSLEKLKNALSSDHETLKRDFERTDYALKESERAKNLGDATLERLSARIQELEKQERDFTEKLRTNEDKVHVLTEQKVCASNSRKTHE